MPTCDPTHHPILQERKYWDYDIVAARRRDIARRLAEEGEAGRGRATDDEEEEGEDIYEADRGEAAVEEEEGEFEEDGEMEGGELLARRRKFRGRDIDPHVLQPLRSCLFGCGAMVFPEEGGICCASGSHILGPDFNPPIDARYLNLLQQPFMGSDSRVLNSALAMGTQQVFPSKSLGGVGFVHHSFGHVHLMGRTYLVLQGLHGHSGFDNHLLPENRWMAGA